MSENSSVRTIEIEMGAQRILSSQGM